MWAARATLVLLACGAGAAGGAGGAGGCGPGAAACRGGGCVRADQWCDGAAQCADGSDEPPGCSVCNRTYHGRAGVAYSLAVREAPRVPFLCHLTFTAGGGAGGELVQLSFDEFTVGRWAGGAGRAGDACPDGYMQLAELGRPFTGGSWCGQAEAPALYYSETSTVTVSVKLFRARPDHKFAFKLRYKFLSQRDAVVRFGLAEAPLERGAVSPGTYCTRTYEECHRKRCRLQSPNYPGMYPRNVSCYWSLRQKDIPTCKHAMISVRQDYSHKMQIKRSIAVASMNKTGRVVRAWGECTGERDRLIVYDGGSTDDPVLLEYCGGDWLPRVTARGPDMLVAFHSSPFGAPLRPAAPLRGFELDVDVIFADSDSLDYAREVRRCEFHLKASSSEDEGNATAAAGAGRGRRGLLRAPQHSLPSNTTCTWTFHGRPGDIVWIYFSSFTHYSLVEARRGESGEREEGEPPRPAPARPAASCAVELRIWEGGEGAAPVGVYCDTPPVLCARASLANATRTPRPCAPPDGYVSNSSSLSMSARLLVGTATHPLSFSLHYEFVDARLEGTPLAGRRAAPAQCARSLPPGEWGTPRNALWFGRGGAVALRCVYRLEAAGSGARLWLTAASFGKTPRCITAHDPHSGRPACRPLPSTDPPPADPPPLLEPDPDVDVEELTPIPHLWIYDSPWPGYRVPLACVCDNSSVGLSALSLGGGLEVELVGGPGGLAAGEDQRHLHARGGWERLPSPRAPQECAARRRSPPPGEHLHLTYPYEGDYMSECGETPFLLLARGNRSVWVRVWGVEPPPAPLDPPAAPAVPAQPACHTTNRVLIYDAHTSRLLRAICPSADDGEESPAVHTFSPEWERGGGGAGGGGALLVVWAAREAGAARLHWMEVWRGGAAGNGTAGCRHACGALGGCMPGALWCDGVGDCPGAADEVRCGPGARLLRLLGGARGAAAGSAALLAAAGALLLAAAWRRRGGAGGKAAAAGGRRLTEELLFDSRASTAS